MRRTIRFLLLLTSSLALTALVSGQSLVEHTAAASGASAGAAAGKAVSDGLGGLSGLLSGAAKTGEPKQELPTPAARSERLTPKPKGAAKPSESEEAPAGAIAIGSGIFIPQGPETVAHVRSAHTPMPLAVPEPREPRQARTEDLARVHAGMPESELLAMGAFGSRVTIPEDDGHMTELFRYGNTTVQVMDGKVVSVKN